MNPENPVIGRFAAVTVSYAVLVNAVKSVPENIGIGIIIELAEQIPDTSCLSDPEQPVLILRSFDDVSIIRSIVPVLMNAPAC